MYYVVVKEDLNNEEEVKVKIDDCAKKYLSDNKLYLKLIISNKNGLLYELDYSEYTDKLHYIGDIMIQFSNVLSHEYNVRLGQFNGPLEFFYKGIPNNYELLTEEVFKPNISIEKFKDKMCSYFDKIETKDKKLLIIDNYLFSPKTNKELLISLLKESNCSELYVITKKLNYSTKVFNSIFNCLQKNIEVQFSDKFHDRYWIADNKKGFLLGTSLTKVGKSFTTIKDLNCNEIESIINYINSLNLFHLN